ncbi:hypothetical protein JCM5353_008230 [Sporobolomyces roseus]
MVNPTFDPTQVERDTRALLGPQTAGWQVGFVLYGVYLSLHYGYITSKAYSRLATQVKGVIWIVFTLLLVYEILAFADSFRWMVTLDRTQEDIILGTWVDFITSFVAGSVAVVVQVFLTVRASVLIRQRWMQWGFLIVMGIAILASFTGAILTTATSFMYHNYTIEKVSITFNQSVGIWLWCAAFVDITISVSLFITLKQRIGGFNEGTDSLLRKLIVISLQTAAYTSILAVAGAIVSLVFKDSNPAFALLHFAFWTPLPPCYAISLYTTLSSRKTIDDHLGTVYPLARAEKTGLSMKEGKTLSQLSPLAQVNPLQFEPTARVSSIPVYSPTIFAMAEDWRSSRISKSGRRVGTQSLIVEPDRSYY